MSKKNYLEWDYISCWHELDNIVMRGVNDINEAEFAIKKLEEAVKKAKAYDNIMSADDKINKIVEKIYNDVTDRRGIKQAFWSCDEIVINEIKNAWFDIIKKEISQIKPESLKPIGDLPFDQVDGEILHKIDSGDTIILQPKNHMPLENKNRLESELASKLGCNVVIVPFVLEVIRSNKNE